MARIRTIKPEFFTSEDIVSLSPLARLLYIALWCEADREGRLVWKPKTFKLRYLPADECNVEALCSELVERGLVVLYGEGYAYIPAFSDHQHINPREAASTLPEPTRQARVSDASPRDSDAQGGKERKGKEGIDDASSDASVIPIRQKTRKTPLPADFALSERVRRWAAEKGHTRLEERFEHFVSAAKARGYTYADWDEALMTAIRDDWARLGPPQVNAPGGGRRPL